MARQHRNTYNGAVRETTWTHHLACSLSSCYNIFQMSSSSHYTSFAFAPILRDSDKLKKKKLENLINVLCCEKKPIKRWFRVKIVVEEKNSQATSAERGAARETRHSIGSSDICLRKDQLLYKGPLFAPTHGMSETEIDLFLLYLDIPLRVWYLHKRNSLFATSLTCVLEKTRDERMAVWQFIQSVAPRKPRNSNSEANNRIQFAAKKCLNL